MRTLIEELVWESRMRRNQAPSSHPSHNFPGVNSGWFPPQQQQLLTAKTTFYICLKFKDDMTERSTDIACIKSFQEALKKNLFNCNLKFIEEGEANTKTIFIFCIRRDNFRLLMKDNLPPERLRQKVMLTAVFYNDRFSTDEIWSSSKNEQYPVPVFQLNYSSENLLLEEHQATKKSFQSLVQTIEDNITNVADKK